MRITPRLSRSEERRTENGFEFTYLKRKRRLRNVHTLGRTAERAVLDYGMKVTQLAQGNGQVSSLSLRTQHYLMQHVYRAGGSRVNSDTRTYGHGASRPAAGKQPHERSTIAELSVRLPAALSSVNVGFNPPTKQDHGGSGSPSLFALETCPSFGLQCEKNREPTGRD